MGTIHHNRQWQPPRATTPSETARRLLHEKCPHCGCQMRDPFHGTTLVHDPRHCPARPSTFASRPSTQ